MKYTRLYALSYKETIRFLKVWTQTILSSVMIAVLYFAVFGGALSSEISEVEGVSYLAFIVPGLIIMQATSNAFQNPSSSLIISKYHGTIKDLLISPFTPLEKALGYTIGATIRGVLVAAIILLVAKAFLPNLHIEHPIVLFFIILFSSAIFGVVGTLTGLWAKTFDHTAGIGTFIITPMAFLGGVFYSLEMLPPLAQNISLLNPILYMVDSTRYAFFGGSFIDIWLSLGVILMLFTVLFLLLWRAFAVDWRLK